MTSLDPQFGGAGELPHLGGADSPATMAARHEAGETPPKALNRRARRRQRREQEHRERYGFRDFAEDALDLALDVLFFWR